MNKKNHKVTEDATTSAAMTPVRVEDWTLFASGEGQHWIRDLDLAERAGLKNPHDIRAHIRKAHADEAIGLASSEAKLEGQFRVVTEVVTSGKGRTHTVPAYYLDQEAALVLVTRLRTPMAIDLTKAIVRVFLEVVRRRRAPRAEPLPVSPEGVAMAVAATIAPLLTQALAPLVGRLVALEQQRQGGVVGASVAGHIKKELRDIGVINHRCGQAKSVRSARTTLDNRLRGSVHWAGTACSWERLPSSKHGDALRELDIMRRTAAGIAEAMGRARQLPLKLVKA